MSGEGDLGGTLTGSEEELVRQRDKNVDKIQVVTDVEIVSQYGGDDNGRLDIEYRPVNHETRQ